MKLYKVSLSEQENLKFFYIIDLPEFLINTVYFNVRLALETDSYTEVFQYLQKVAKYEISEIDGTIEYSQTVQQIIADFHKIVVKETIKRLTKENNCGCDSCNCK